MLSFFFLAHLGVLLCFLWGTRVSPLLAPAAVLVSLAVPFWIPGEEGRIGRLRFMPQALALGVVALSVFLASRFFDLSWDGLWYHQTAVFQMAHGWNPLREPLHDFDPTLQIWVRHYAKGPWYVALALFETTQNIESAKAGPWMALAASVLSVFAAGLDFGWKRRVAAMVALLVGLNPVVLCELASSLVDGVMISFMACCAAGMFRSFRRPSPLMNWITLVSAVLSINAKLTGLVYICFLIAAGGLFVLIRRRDLVGRYILFHSSILFLGAALFGFNPYVTNTVHWGNPFYPWLGTAAHPGFTQRDKDPNELYETPKNMVGHNRLFRLGYAIFGRPGAQPYHDGPNARLMWPFDVRWKDFRIFYFHEVRISGFGSLFSGALLIGLFLLAAALVRPTGFPREVLVLAAGAVVLSLLIALHTWWARYGPQLWWLPIFAVMSGLAEPSRRWVRWGAWSLAMLLLANGILVGIAHFRWEIEATRTTREQLAFLRLQEGVQVDLQYFGEPFGERLRAAGVRFQRTNQLKGDQQMELMSVAPGYPGAVRASFRRAPRSAPASLP